MDHFWGRGTVYADTTGVPAIYYYSHARRLTTVADMPSPVRKRDVGIARLADFGIPPQDRPIVAPVALRTRTDWEASDFDMAGPDVIAGVGAYGRAFLDRSTGQYLILWNSGAVDYLSGVKTYEPSDMSEEQALAVAKTFVDTHGGMPSDAQLSQVIERRRRSINAVDGLPQADEIIGYAFEFTHTIGGLPFEGFGGDRIFVSVGSCGVEHCYRLWREPQGPVDEPCEAVGASQAVAAVKSRFAESGDTARLAYLSAPYPEHQDVAFPVWMVRLADGRDVPVQATTGEIIACFDDWEQAVALGIPTAPPMPQVDPDGGR